MREALPTARAEQTSYENIETRCPSCRRTCILNRRSDLKTFTPVAGKEVRCTECRRPFWLVGDTINAGYESILYDCVDLLRAKRFMLCVVGTCQSYEMFFGLYLRVELVYKPFGAECRSGAWPSIDSLNALNTALRRSVGRLPFGEMRTRFLRQVISHAPPQDLLQAKAAIDSLKRPHHRRPPAPAELDAAPIGERLKQLLRGVASTEVHKLRNRVVHKEGYRPSREEAESTLNEAKSLLPPLGSKLNLYENVNSYTRRKMSLRSSESACIGKLRGNVQP